jgi:uroporphyrinogen decarboxylase
MTPKERLLRTISHQSIDRLPTQINYTSRMGAKLCAHFGVTERDLPAFLGNHLLRVEIASPKRLSEDGKIAYDWWGVGFSTEDEGYRTIFNPLAEDKNLDSIPWPEPRAAGLFDAARQILQADGGSHFAIPNLGFALFERAWALRGFEAFLLDLALDPAFAEELLERITLIQLELIHQFIALGVDGGYFGDDYGAQKSLLFSPRLWRRLIKPRLARLFAPFRQAGLPVWMHSDGQIAAILPDLVEIGLAVYNPVQPEVIDQRWLRATFGERLAYYGGISTQTVLPTGTPAQIRAAVQQCVENLAPAGTGLILAPSHRLMSDIPLENVEALLAAFEQLR